MKFSNKVFLFLGFLLTGAIMQNVIWYLRLQKPYLLREFLMYLDLEGPGLFLMFNTFNFFYLGILVSTWVIFFIIDILKEKRKIQPKRYNHIKTIKIPTEVEFKHKDGRKIKIKAHRIVRK